MANGESRLGYLGLGLMGGPMALRLATAGYALRVWNRSPDKTEPLVAAGAEVAATPRAVAEGSDIVFTCLTDTAAVEAVVFGADGIASGASQGKVLVDFSSMRPDRAAEFAARLRRETGMGWIDAPVSGGVPGATNGTLTVMAGGTPEDFARVEPVVAQLSGRFTLMGPNGAGQTTKLINQMIVSTGLALMAECADENIHFPGFVDDRETLAAYFASADIYVSAMENETFGISVIEAQAAGLPVVGVKAGAMVDRVPPSLGRLGPCGDADAMGANIAAVWMDRLSGMGERARAHAQENFSWPRTFEKLVFEIYPAALRKRAGEEFSGLLGQPHSSQAQAS